MNDETKPVIKDDFEDPSVGENFGGSYPRLNLEQGATSGMLSFIKDDELEIKDDSEGAQPGAKKTLVLHVLQDLDSGALCTCPIGAVMDNVWLEANVKKGDVFRVKRYADQPKKEGRGKGNLMKIYGIKVYSRQK